MHWRYTDVIELPYSVYLIVKDMLEAERPPRGIVDTIVDDISRDHSWP